TFQKKSELRPHRCVLTQQKPYKCPECDKSYSNRQSLKKHQTVHVGSGPVTQGELQGQ
ncbi:Z585B protein, partial [Turnix velox]|nr:Z585B protein [Turnix velox]